MVQKIITKNAFAGIILGAILSLVLFGCSSTEDVNFSGLTGGLSVQVATDITVGASAASRSTGPEYDPENFLETIKAEDLGLKLVSTDGAFSKTWEKVSDFNADEEFPAGTYTLSAFYGEASEEGINKPYLQGESAVTISAGKTTDVSLVASLQNGIVGVTYTDDFLNYFDVFSIGVVTKYNEFRFSQSESHPQYISAGTVNVAADVTLDNGKTGTVVFEPFTAEAATYHLITMDVNATKGTIVMTVSFDDELEDVTVELEMADHLFDASCPVVKPEGFEGGAPTPFVEGNVVKKAYKYNIIARRGLQSAYLYKNSPLFGGGFRERYDLLNEATRNDLARLYGVQLFGLKEGEMFGKIDMSNWVSFLKRYDSSLQSEDITFTLEITDREGITTLDELAVDNDFVVRLYGESLEMGWDEVEIYDDYYEVPVYTNMNWLNGRLNLSQTEFEDVKYPKYEVVDSVIDESYATMNRYTVRIPYPKEFYSFQHDTKTNAGTSGESYVFVGTLPQLEIVYDPADIFVKSGKFAFRPVQEYENIALYNKILSRYNGQLVISARDDQGNFISLQNEEEDGVYSFDNLEYSQSKWDNQEALKITCTADLSIFVNNREVSTKVDEVIETERPLQLPNSDFEDWNSTALKPNIVLWTLGDGSVWGTLNQRTCVTTGATNQSYIGTSGTKSTTGKVGSGAVIRTIGYGAGNTNGGPILGSYTYNASQGELYLGYYDDSGVTEGPVYGVPFGSRPKAISFYCRYSPKSNNDKGLIYVTLKNNGRDIATRTIEISNSYFTDLVKEGDYYKIELEFPYTENLKTTDMEFVARSTIVPAALELQSGLLGPKVKNSEYWALDNEQVGAELYIDEIELIY